MPIWIPIGLLAFVVCAVIFNVMREKSSGGRLVPHDYFSRLWLFSHGAHTRWEAELAPSLSGTAKPLSFHANTTHDEESQEAPTESELAFCKSIVRDLDTLFVKCIPAIDEAWSDWVKHPRPADWRSAFEIDGISVPKNGAETQPWGVGYFCKPAGQYFMIEFRDGVAQLDSVDG